MKRTAKIYSFLFALIMAFAVIPSVNASATGNQKLLISIITKKTDISDCNITVAKTVSYTGKALKPKVVVKNGKTTLTNGTHYTVTYSSNKKIGTGKVTITGVEKKGYKGSKTITFKIVPKKPSVSVKDKTTSSFTLSWKKVKGAKKYYIYKYDSKKKKYVQVTYTTKTSYTVKKLSSAKKYEYAVKAYAKKNYTSDYGKITVYTNPAAVKNLKAKPSDTTTTLTWKKVTRATGYIIYKYNTKKKKYEKVATTKKRTYTVKNLKTKTSYKYAVAAYVKKTANAGEKKTVSFKTTALVPLGKVKNLKASVKNAKVTLTWSKTDKAEGYYVYTLNSKGKYTLTATVKKGTAFSVQKTEGSTDTYSVCAYKTADGKKVKGKKSDKLAVTVPFSKVKGLKAAAVSSTAVKLIWEAKEKADGYNIYSYDAKKKTYTLLTDAKKATSFEVKNLKPGTKYYFAVSAYLTKNKKNINGEYSDTITVTTLKSDTEVQTTVPVTNNNPETPTTSPTTGTTTPTTAEKPVTTAPSTTNTPTTTPSTTNTPVTTAPSTTKPTTTKTPSTNAPSDTEPSTTVPSPPNAPVTVSLDDRTETSITIKWSAVRNADYYIVYSFDASSNSYKKLGSTEGTTYTLKNLGKGTVHSFAVSAVRKTASGELEGEKSFPASFSTFPAPGKVTGVNTSVKSNKATVSWKAITDADGYTVYSQNTSDGSLTSLGTAEGKTEFTFSLPEGTAHTIAVKAFVKSKSAFLEGPASESVYVINPFSKITGLKVTSATEYSVTLSWDKKQNAEGYDIFTYNSESGLYSQILDAGQNTSFSVKNLEDNKTYIFAVAAYFTHDNQKITGAHSNNVTTTTKPYIEPSNISITALTDSSMNIKWHSVSDAKSYKVYSYNSTTKEYTLLNSTRFTAYNTYNLEEGKNYSFAVSVVKEVNGKEVESNKSGLVTASISKQMPQELAGVYNTLRSNCFSIKYAMPLDNTQTVPTEYCYKNGNFAISASMSMEGMDLSSRTIYLKDKNEAYILVPMGITGFYTKMSGDELVSENMLASDFVAAFAPDVKAGSPYTVTAKPYDGKNYTCYSFIASSGNIMTYYFYNGTLTDIEETPSRGNKTLMNITSVSSSVDDKVFKLPALFPLGWTKMDL